MGSFRPAFRDRGASAEHFLGVLKPSFAYPSRDPALVRLGTSLSDTSHCRATRICMFDGTTKMKDTDKALRKYRKGVGHGELASLQMDGYERKRKMMGLRKNKSQKTENIISFLSKGILQKDHS